MLAWPAGSVEPARHGRPLYERSTEVTRNSESCGAWHIMAVTAVGSGPTTRLSIWPERTEAHAGPYRVQAQAANDGLKEQTAVGAWAPGWQPGAPKQDLGVSVRGGAQKASGLRGSVAETLHGMSTLRYASA